MNVNIYLQDDLLERIDRMARESGRSRSAVIREAVESMLSRRGASGWPRSLREWKGDSSFPSFEEGRNEASFRSEDPFTGV